MTQPPVPSGLAGARFVAGQGYQVCEGLLSAPEHNNVLADNMHFFSFDFWAQSAIAGKPSRQSYHKVTYCYKMAMKG